MKKHTVKDLLDLKGQRKLTQVNVHTEHEARACQEAGIDMIITWERSDIRAFRSAAPDMFLTVGLVYGQYVNADEARRAAFNAMEKGADAIYCPMALDVVESLAREAIPVHGHVGFVPYKNSWTGGFRAVGKTAEDAFAILERARDYERAGAIAIEVELVPKEVAELISREVGILTVGMGAGAGCDAQYLFAKDILGYNDGHIPRHAKVYRDHRSEYQRLYEDSVAAFGEFREEVESGGFPAAGNLLTMDPAELDALRRKVEP